VPQPDPPTREEGSRRSKFVSGHGFTACGKEPKPNARRPGSPHSKKRHPFPAENQHESLKPSPQSTAPSRSGRSRASTRCPRARRDSRPSGFVSRHRFTACRKKPKPNAVPYMAQKSSGLSGPENLRAIMALDCCPESEFAVRARLSCAINSPNQLGVSP
jgi:hypothetical protein